MFVEERHQEILRLLQENKKVYVKELSKRFQVTEDCIRKDLASMEGQDLLKRTYGGAVLAESLHPGHSNQVASRKDQNIKEKQAIAKKAIGLIQKGDMIFLDTSTTNIELAKEIVKADLNITVVSPMMNIAEVLKAAKKVKFILLGGEFNRSQNGFLGSLTLQMMENFRFDLSFIGVVGVDLHEGAVMTYVPEDGLMKQHAIKRSSRVYLVMESRKFGFSANYVYAGFQDIQGIICEKLPEEKIVQTLKDKQVQLL